MPHIRGITVQSGGSEPHVIAMMHQLATKIPLIKKIGGKVDRTTRTGGKSAHSEGRAIDIYLNANDPRELKLGNTICEQFEKKWYSLKIEQYIWNEHRWNAIKHSEGERVLYGGNKDARGPHKDHIHVEFAKGSLDKVSPSIIDDLIIPVHKHMATRDWDSPVSGWGSWNADDPDLKKAVV